MSEVTVGGASYSVGQLTPMQQLHVARKVAPVLGDVIEAIRLLKNKDDASGLAALMVPLSRALAAMPDKDVDFVVGTCLSVVRRVENGVSAPVVSGSGGGLMYQDIRLPEMSQLVMAVIQENLGSFFVAAGTAPSAAGTSPAA